MSIGEDIEGTIIATGEIEPWVLEIENTSTVDIYMWSQTGSLDTYIYLYEDLEAGPLHENDDNSGAISSTVSDG